MKELFFLSCAETSEGGGVYKYGLDENGKLKKIDYLPCSKPMYAVISKKRLHVLLRAPFTSSVNGGYLSCRLDFSDCTEIKNTLGKCACHLAVDKDVYIVNYLRGNIVKNCDLSVTHSGKGVNVKRQDMPHTHFVAFSPDKKYVLCCDLGIDTIFVYDRYLKEISSAEVPSGYGVRHLVFSNDGKFIYAVNELVPSVSVFAYADGKIEYLNTIMLDCENENSTAAAIRLDEDKLYVSVRGEDAVFVFNADGANLKLCAKTSCGGRSPRDIEIIDNYLICTNENSDNVTVIDKNNFKIIEELSIKNPLCVAVCR